MLLNSARIYFSRSSFLVVFFILAHGLSAQQDSLRIKSEAILMMAKDFHLQAPRQDSAFSERVYSLFLNFLGSESAFFTEADLQALEEYRYMAGYPDFASNLCQITSDVYSRRMLSLKELLAAEAKRVNDFGKVDFYHPEEAKFKDEKAWQAHWHSYVKMRVLWALHQDSLYAPSAEQVKDWQYRVCQNIACRLQNQVDNFEAINQYIEEQYLQALCQAIDPHTTYFNAYDRQQFEQSLSRDALSFGFEVYRNQSGEIEIYKVIPGSPAWRSNQINEGDILLGAGKSGNGQEDFSCLSMTEVLQMVASADTGFTTFSIRKQSGESVQVSLAMESIAVEDNLIETYVLEGDRKIGYIYLPSFYEAEGNYNSGLGCALDISNALIRLKHQGVEGLIFDLRNNGGGSMQEALRLAGMFVDYGALSIFHDRYETETLKDTDRGYIFGKPMLVLMNSYSASASELFAAAMQDRNRALIVGSPSYGKSTAQNIFPLLHYKHGDTSLIPGSFIKLTTGAFYRVTGKTHQKEGVIPDISLPQAYDLSENLEASRIGVMDLQAIEKKTYYFPAKPLPVDELAAQSANRIKSDSAWQGLVKRAHKNPAVEKIPLRLKDFMSYMNEEEVSLFDHLAEDPIYTAESLAFLLSFQPSEDEEGAEVRTSIETDPYIRESFLIINDLIQSNH